MVLARSNKKMRMRTTDSSDWACLPKNVVDEILDRLVTLGDYVRFGAVCRAWRLTALEDRNYRGNQKRSSRAADRFFDHQLPMLMLPSGDDYVRRARFYSVINKKVLDFDLSFPKTRRFIGSSLGWLISVDNKLAITLFNPFSGANIRLPPVICLTKADFKRQARHGQDDLFVKAILSADPSFHPNKFVVMVIVGKRRMLAFIRPGVDTPRQKRWVHYCRLHGFCDVIYSKSNAVFYALHDNGQVFMIDTIAKSNAVFHRSGQFFMINTNANALDFFLPSLEPEPEPPCKFRYIVETASGDLLQVLRYMKGNLTYEFKVFKLNSSSPIPYWVELKSLGDQVLFLGDSSSQSVMVSDFPGCQPGSIYFSLPFPHLRLYEPNDMGWVNLQSGVPIERFHIGYEYFDSWDAFNNPPAIWVVPTFQEADAAGMAKRPDWSLWHNRSKFGWIKKNKINSSALPRFWDPADWSNVLALSL